MKAFAWLFLFAVMAVIAWAGDLSASANGRWLSVSLSGDSSAALIGPCFDIATDGANITHIFVDPACGASASAYLVTADGVPVTEYHTEGSPCESVPREV
jgi:hypothetical protein